MTLIAPPRGIIKPPQWNFDPALVEPRWRWAWDGDPRLMVPMWEGGGFARDLVRGRQASLLNAAPSWSEGERGVQRDYTTGDGEAFADEEALSITGPLTVAIGVVSDVSQADSSFRTIVEKRAAGGSEFLLNFKNSEPRVQWGWHSGGGFQLVQVARTVPTGEVAHYMMVRNGDADGFFYQDGLLIGSDNTLAAAAASPNGVALAMRENASEQWDGKILYLYIWAEAHGANRAQQLATDPFGPFRPARRRRVFVAAAGGLDNARLADLAFCRGRMRFGPGRLPVPDGTIG